MFWKKKKNKVLVIGLDCAAPQLVFDQWIDDLPNLRKLTREGVYGELESTIPPITVPAWTCMMTSKDPGQLGFYGFRNRARYDYDGYAFATASLIKEPTVWDILSRNNKKVILLGVPQTYPPKRVNGYMVTSFLTPSIESQYTYPNDFRNEIEKVVGRYIIDVDNFRTDDKQALLRGIYEMTETRFKLARHLVKNKDWDFFMMVEMGVDRIHHGFWKYFDPTHRKYEKGNPLENAIKDYYIYLDREIGSMLSLIDSNTTVLVTSDHGARSMEGGICINEWLLKEGLLTLSSEYPDTITSPSKVEFDWKKTKVWGEGGYYARIFFNVKGREPDGVIPQEEYESFRDEMIEKIKSIPDEKGNDIGTVVYKPEEVYNSCNNVPPDLIVYFGDLSWRSVGSFGFNDIYTFENDTGPDDANHDRNGIFIMWKDKMNLGSRLEGLKIYDCAPLCLSLLDQEIPGDMIGKVPSSARNFK